MSDVPTPKEQASVDVRTLKRALENHSTLEQLASALGVEAATLITWIEGKKTPPYEIFLAALKLATRQFETKKS